MLNHVISDVFHNAFLHDPHALALTIAFEHVHNTSDDAHDCFDLLYMLPKFCGSPKFEPLELYLSKASIKPSTEVPPKLNFKPMPSPLCILILEQLPYCRSSFCHL